MDIEILEKCGKIINFKYGDIICREGDEGHSMFILLKGSVKIMLNSFSNNVQSLGCMPEGSFFGEMSLLENKPRSATIFANSDTVIVLEINEKYFPLLLQNATSIAHNLFITLKNRLNSMLERIEPEDKKFVYQYRKEPLYTTIQKIHYRAFDTIAQEDPDYVWQLLKYLSYSLEQLNKRFINNIENQD